MNWHGTEPGKTSVGDMLEGVTVPSGLDSECTLVSKAAVSLLVPASTVEWLQWKAGKLLRRRTLKCTGGMGPEHVRC